MKGELQMIDSNFGLGGLKVGKRVKVKGSPNEDGTFQAIEINLKTDTKASVDEISIEGLIQSIDHEKKTLRLLNREVTLPDGIEVKDSQSNTIDLKDLKAGDTAKLKGKYSEDAGFMPEKIKKKEIKGFNIEELQGIINKIDSEKKTFELAGITVREALVSEKSEVFYNRVYSTGGSNKEYFKEPEDSIYYPVWSKIIDWIRKDAIVADFGCGPGQFAKLAFKKNINYVLGVDFSDEAIEMAQELNPEHKNVFIVGNLYNKDIFCKANFDTAIFSEVLEHIEDDLGVLSSIKRGTHIIITLPSFASEGHVRYFVEENAILDRYKTVIDIKEIFAHLLKAEKSAKIYLMHGFRK